jgi:UDP-2-acetamido-2-deoxy-ribo-hexuluronate aminotransferase
LKDIVGSESVGNKNNTIILSKNIKFIIMNEIEMVDLKNQYKKIKHEINTSIQEVLDNTTFINGPQVINFIDSLKNYLGVKHVIPCANGTDALQIAMMGLEFKPGSELIVPAFTYIATVEAIVLLGLKPILIDVNEETFELDIKQLESKITKSTAGIVVVHLYGQCSNMEEILKISKKYNLKVIEDNAQSLGAIYTFSNNLKMRAGTIGDVGTTSFFPSKNLGCYGDGGAIFTNNDNLAKKIRMIANHGQSEKYYHDTIGVNSRLDSIQASILNVKLKYLDDYIFARNKVAIKYDNSLAQISKIYIPKRVKNSTHVFHQYTIRLDESINRDSLKNYLSDKGIQTMIYYPLPIHLQKAYNFIGGNKGQFPIAEKLCEQVLSLPIHTEMKDEVQDYIIQQISKYFYE